ncbi:hypothetical protein MBM_04716 [Drepanopeziza brunnea f. sp. 'multigermtubi' MB_m1]|uniref:Uncharacterized protein n=1 Tax=Marssonina brunnea f. sp. multigermtubi (strain MB_m1) TaxID=1072389 RepID=K1XWP2_MARBU|nr:uncharacterized protein MBM_04716 [Drepanopeziza brunnea f. sp. 'multigermtubi' MB_m1]EKD17139.1 hypothetical protein MBM_04716 [Drepanopeziza brunnea f. sp. 'multigermtubi' MB_m1]
MEGWWWCGAALYDSGDDESRGGRKIINWPSNLNARIHSRSLETWYVSAFNLFSISPTMQALIPDFVADPSKSDEADRYHGIFFDRHLPRSILPYIRIHLHLRMHFDWRKLAAKIGTLAAFGPHLFVIIWAGSDITGGLLQAYDRAGYEPSNAISTAIGATSSVLGLSTSAHPADGIFLYKS